MVSADEGSAYICVDIEGFARLSCVTHSIQGVSLELELSYN